ncbi:MAG: LytTR family DNA-binding domain-containing protein [Atopobiaceae bacterium]
MKVSLVEHEGVRGIEVTVTSQPNDPRASRLVDALRVWEGRLSGYEDPSSIRRRVVSLGEVSSVRTQGDHAVLQLADGSVLHSGSRLGQLEDALAGTSFVRVSRQELVNLDNARTIRPEFGSRLVLGLEGGFEAMVTRSYVAQVKKSIGIRA